MSKRSIIYIFAGVFATLFLVVFLVNNGTQNPAISSPQGEQENNQQAENSIDRTVSIEVGDTEFSFSPENITVGKGEVVRFNFKNTGQYPHNFKVETEDGELLGGTKVIPKGETDTFILTMPKRETTITLTSYCSVPGHRESGMVGQIIVE